jgi:hypothetical protein
MDLVDETGPSLLLSYSEYLCARFHIHTRIHPEPEISLEVQTNALSMTRPDHICANVDFGASVIMRLTSQVGVMQPRGNTFQSTETMNFTRACDLTTHN